MTVAKVLSNNGAEVMLGFENGTFKTINSSDIGFLALAGEELEIYTSEDGSKTTYVKHEEKKNSNNNNLMQQFDEEFHNKHKVSKIAYLMLSFFLGGIGIHKFYAKKYIMGALYLLFCWTYIPAIIAFVEFLMAIFNKADKNGDIEV